MKSLCARRAFTLLEIFVILAIIAMFLALLVPFALRLREGGRSSVCVANMQRIGKAIKSYAAEHEDRLPGPLTVDQYPVDSAGSPPRDGQLLKYIATYLNNPSGAADAASARTIFTFPAWQRAEHTTDAPVFLINNEPVMPFNQPAWGGDGKPALKFADLEKWTKKVGERQEPVLPSKIWALTEADQEVAKLVQLKAPWVSRMPARPVHVNLRNGLYFDMHVEPLVLSKATGQATVD
jgi:type II secretory pathway pseudopilin PulG